MDEKINGKSQLKREIDESVAVELSVMDTTTMLMKKLNHNSGHMFIRTASIVALFASLLSGPSPASAQEEESKRVWQLEKSLSTPDGLLTIEVSVTRGDWPMWRVMVCNRKTGEKRELDFSHDGLSIQGTPLLSSGGNILVITIGGASYGTEPVIFQRGADGWFEKLQMEVECHAWECAVKSGRFPSDARSSHIYLHPFAIDEKNGLINIAVAGDAQFHREEKGFKKGQHSFEPFGVYYDYNHLNWQMMRKLPKNWAKSAEPVRPMAFPVVPSGS